ncbi:MAG: AsmA family protein [Deltaproteobacteria bacterium]|nr:AsmA family protein [Deltaproteobacteria bacterium]
MLRRIVKWLLWGLAVLIFILTIGVAALWMMPRAVSTDWAKKQIEIRASRALHAPVTMDGLQWTWKEGIRIEGLRVADDQAFSADPILSLDRLTLHIDPVRLMDRLLYLDLQMEGLKARVIRGQDGRTNLEAWLARIRSTATPPPETRPAEPGDWRNMALALPGDLNARIRLERSAILVEDRQAKRSLTIRDIALLLSVPSLVHKPITMTLSSTQEMDGTPLPPVELSLSVEHMVDSKPAVRLNTASIQARCRLPGLDLAVSGGLSDMGIEGKLDLDLAALMEAAGPLAPSTLPAVSGEVAFTAKAHLGSGDEIAYDMTLSGSRLAIAGGPLKERRVGPVALRFSQKGTVTPEKKELTIAQGKLRIQEKTRLQWEGRVRRADTSGIDADLAIAAIAIDLKEIAGLAGPFLPMDVTSGWSPKEPQGVFVEQVHLNGILPAGAVHVAVKGLRVDLPGLRLAHAENGLSAKGMGLRMSGADVRLQDQFPLSIDMRADLEIQDLSLTGPQPVHVHGLKATDVHVTMQDLVRSSKALLGVSGTVHLTESVTIARMDAPGLASIPDMHHDLKASILMQDRPPLMKLSAQTAVESPSPRIDPISKQPIQGGMHLEAQIEDLDIASLTPLMADVGGMEAAIRLGQLLDMQIKGEAAALGAKAFRANGRARLDLNAAGALIPASVRPKGSFAGALDVDWRLEGRRPTPGELKTFSDRGLSLARRLEALGFINRVELKAGLKNVGLDLHMKGGASLSARGIRSVSPLTVIASSGLQSLLLEGNLAVDAISQIPGSRAFEPPLSATLSFRADSRDLSSLQIREALHIDPLSIDQDLHISLNRLGRLLNLEDPPTLSTLLRHLDGTLTAGLRTTLGPSLAPFTPGLALTGPLNAGLGVELNGGKRISARVSLESAGLDVTAQQAHIQGLTSHIHLTKTYGLQFEGEEKDSPGSGSALLSRKVLRPARAPALPSGPGNALVRRLVEDLGGSMSGPPALSFESATLKGGPFPLELRHGQMQFRLAGSLPALDRFQLDAMGGSILGDLRITRQDDLSRLEMNGAFSGLDARTLLPEPAPGERTSPHTDPDTQVSGQVSLRMPVSHDSVQVMNNLSAGIRLTHIGSRTLERLLYAMDPYEANEGIVRQRALLRKGTPEWVDVQIRHGNLSLAGSVAAMGTSIPLPAVERLNLTNLPIHARLQKILGRLGPVEKGLKTLSADSILIGKDSDIRFVGNGR